MAAAELKKTDQVLEIGPGLGPLTELLVEQAGEVLAIEKDARLVEVLKQRFKWDRRPPAQGAPAGRRRPAFAPRRRPGLPEARSARLERVEAGRQPALLRRLADSGGAGPGAGGRASSRVQTFPEDGAREDARPPEQPAAAIPGRGPQRMVATLQIEVAKRLMAKPGTPDYGVLTLLVQLDYEPRGWFKIPASCFFPEPDVDSACVCLVRREQPLLAAEQRDAFVRDRQTQLFAAAQDDAQAAQGRTGPSRSLAREFERLNLSPQIRARGSLLEQFVGLAQVLSATFEHERRNFRCRQRAGRGHRPAAAQRGASAGLDAPGGACAGVQRGGAGLSAKALA